MHEDKEYELIEINDKLNVTPEHLVYTNDGWKKAGELTLDDVLLNFDGGEEKIESLDRVVEETEVYNLETKLNHNYFAEGVLVHNKVLALIEQQIQDYLSIAGGFEANIRSQIPLVREGGLYEGHIYRPYIEENRKAIADLAEHIEDSDLLISIEKGGSLVADLILEKSGSDIENIKIPKAERSEQHTQLKQAVREYIGQHPREVTIIATETVIGGGSAQTMLDSLESLVREYPNLKFKLLLEQETLGKTIDEVRTVVRETNYPDKIEVIFAQTPFLIGEDINLESIEDMVIFERKTTQEGKKTIEAESIPSEGRTIRERIIELIAAP